MIHKPKVKLSGGDGNVFTILGKVQRALREDGQRERASEFLDRATQPGMKYDDVIALTFDYVDPS